MCCYEQALGNSGREKLPFDREKLPVDPVTGWGEALIDIDMHPSLNYFHSSD